MKRKKRFRLFSVVRRIWKRRSGYTTQRNDDTVDSAHSHPSNASNESRNLKLPQETYFTSKAKNSWTSLPRNWDMDSFQESIESMDSLVASCWDPEDELSQATAVMSNKRSEGMHQTSFLEQHLSFLSSQTQPREVELVYN